MAHGVKVVKGARAWLQREAYLGASSQFRRAQVGHVLATYIEHELQERAEAGLANADFVHPGDDFVLTISLGHRWVEGEERRAFQIGAERNQAASSWTAWR